MIMYPTTTIDEFISDVVDPYGEQSIDQQESIEKSYFQFQISSVLTSIGKRNSSYDIDLFFNDFYYKLDNDSKRRFISDCFIILNQVYHLGVIKENVSLFVTLEQMKKNVLPLLFFFEKEESLEMFSNCFPYSDLKVLRNYDLFKKFVELNYSNFLNCLNKSEQYLFLIKQLFLYASLDNVIFILWKIVSKNTIAIYSKQITKGELK